MRSQTYIAQLRELQAKLHGGMLIRDTPDILRELIEILITEEKRKANK